MGRRLPRSPAVAAPLDDDDLLSEILLRLPPLPSLLPRASAVCERWRSLASDPAFSRRFRRHHSRNPPLLGFFHRDVHGLSFVPTLDAPNRIPPGRFSLQFDNHSRLLGCRHGLVLIFNDKALQLLVWDPSPADITTSPFPRGSIRPRPGSMGAVLRSAAGDVKHFKVALVMVDNKAILNTRVLACVYSSDTGVWGNLISTPITYGTQVYMQPAALVGDSLHWLLNVGSSFDILEFGLERQRLGVIEMPISDDVRVTVIQSEGGGMGLLCVSGFTAQLWKRNTYSDGVGSWGRGTTIELDKLLNLNSDSDLYPVIHGFAEDQNLVLLRTGVSLFTVQLESLDFKELPEPETWYYCHTFESVYAAGNSMPSHCCYTRTRFLFGNRFMPFWNSFHALSC